MSSRIIENYLTPNPYSRPQLPIREIKGIVVHWVANPMTSAKNNRDYFESRKGGLKSYGSAHEIIDLDGDIVICIPKNELAYHVGSEYPYKAGTNQIYTPEAWERLNTNLPRMVKPYPNNCTYGIECCHIDWDGKMTNATYDTLVSRCAELCKEFGLDPLKDLWTHQEVVGWKDCHRWFVKNPNEWAKFKSKVKEIMEENEDMKPLQISDYEWQMLNRIWSQRYNAGEITDWKWMQKIREKKLTAGELSFLNSVIAARKEGLNTEALNEGMK